MNDFWEFFVGIVICLAIVGGVFTGVAHLAEASSHDECHNKGELAQVQVTYRKWNDCFVNQNGLWMPFDIWKYNRDHGIKMN